MSHGSRQQYPPGYGGPSCFNKALMGLAMGSMVGSAFGVILGGYGGYRAGMHGRELLKHIGKSALQSGGAFGGFMTVGSVIRCDDYNSQVASKLDGSPNSSHAVVIDKWWMTNVENIKQ